jgi:hypothetical protein
MRKLFLLFTFLSLFANFSFALDNQELRELVSRDLKNSNFKPYIEQNSGGLVRLMVFNPSSANSSSELSLIKKAINYASSVAAPYGRNLMDIKKSSYPKVKNFSVYVLRKSQTEPAALNMIGAASSEVRAIAVFPETADNFRMFVFIDDSPFNPEKYSKVSEGEFLLETIVNFIHEVYGHAFEVIKNPSLASRSSGEQEVIAYTVQLEGLKKLKQNYSSAFDAQTQKLLDTYIEDTKLKIEYFKNNSY